MAEYWWEQDGWTSDLAPYVIMIRAFIDGRLTATEFETLFLVLFKRDTTEWSGDTFHALDTLFGDVDAYHPDASIREQTDGIDEQELRLRATLALNSLKRP